MKEYQVRERDEAYEKRYAEDFSNRPNECHGLKYDTMLKSYPPWYVYLPCDETPTKEIDGHKFCDSCYTVYDHRKNPPKDYIGEFMEKLKEGGYFENKTPTTEEIHNLVNMAFKDDKMISPEEFETLTQNLLNSKKEG